MARVLGHCVLHGQRGRRKEPGVVDSAGEKVSQRRARGQRAAAAGA